LTRTSDHLKDTDALTQPELNPLQNPLLAENMGRWAEVYFTNPPERRDDAVLELLRELEREHSQAKSSAPTATAHLASLPKSSGAGQTFSAQARPELRFCVSCGHENPVTHQFCGMCGAGMHPDLPEEASREAEPVNSQVGRGTENPLAGIESKRSDPDRISGGDASEESYAESQQERPEPVFNSPAAGSDSLSLFQSFRSARAEDENWDYEPPRSNSSRFYIAAVLVIIIGGLAYMAWRGSQNSVSSHGASPPPPAPVTDNPSGPTTSPAASNPEQTAPPENAAHSAAPAPPVTSKQASRKAEAAKAQPATKTLPTPNEATPSNSSTAGGVEELATAERYLSGTDGRARDGSEAAQWLWKSVAKHNGQAILLLADLYLRGDGVSKNCDQGRVLLDSAAQKGVAGAGERLRNLQAFGCR